MSDSSGFIELILRERRSLETALADLVTKYHRSSCKSAELARMIRQLEAEIRDRQTRSGEPGVKQRTGCEPPKIAL
jgi:hypothetical protein